MLLDPNSSTRVLLPGSWTSALRRELVAQISSTSFYRAEPARLLSKWLVLPACPPCCLHRPATAHPAAGRPRRAPPCLRAALLVARHPALPAMASLTVLSFYHEGRPIKYDTWLDDLQLYLLSDFRDRVSLFDHTSRASLAPPATADSATLSQRLTRDAAARLAGPAPSSVSQVDPLPGTVPVEVALDSGTARGAAFEGAEPARAEPGGAKPTGAEPGGAESEGAGSGGAEPGDAEPGGTEPTGAEPGGPEPAGAEPGGAEPEGAEPGGAESEGAEPGGASPRLSPRPEPLSPQKLREWFAQRTRLRSGDAAAGGFAARGTGAGGDGATSLGGAGVPAEAGGTGGIGGAGAAGPRGARTRGTGAARPGGVGGAGAGGAGAGDPGPGGAGVGGPGASAGAVDPGAGGACAGGAASGGTGAGGTVQHRPFFVPLPQSSLPPPDSVLRQILSLPSSTCLPRSLLSPPPRQSQPQPAHCLLIACSLPAHCLTHVMALRPSSVPLRVPLLPPPESSLPALPYPESDLACAASPTVSRLLATAVTDPSFESTTASVLVAELVDFTTTCRLDYATSLVAKSESHCPPSVGGEYALGTDVLEDRQKDFACLAVAVPHLVAMLLALEGDSDAPFILTPRSYAEAIEGPYSSQWQRAMDAEMASWKSTGTYVDVVPPPGRTSMSLAALGFAPSIADPSLFLCTDTSLPPFYVLVYVDDLVFATADTKALALVKSELQKRHSCTDLGELRSYLGLQITRDRARHTITLTQSHMVQHVLQRFGFRYSSPQSTPLPTGHSLSAPPSNESVEPSGPYPERVGYLMYLMTCTRPDLAYPLSILARYVAPRRHRTEHWEAAKRVLRYLCSTSGMGLVLRERGPVVLTGHADASWVDDLATLRSSQGYTFSLGFGSVSWRSTRSSLVLSSSCEAEIYTGAMAAQELCWLTYLLTDLGERPRSSPVLYVNNKAMIASYQEHRVEHITKHIALRYFLAQELQQRGQPCLAYMVIWANTADIFTKVLQSGDHQCFSTVLGLVPMPHLLTA
ncbi:unnamed protein product [Closterium sp. NIES-54]